MKLRVRAYTIWSWGVTYFQLVESKEVYRYYHEDGAQVWSDIETDPVPYVGY